MILIKNIIIFFATIVVCILFFQPILYWILEMVDIDKYMKWCYNYNQSVVDFLNNLFGIKKKETK